MTIAKTVTNDLRGAAALSDQLYDRYLRDSLNGDGTDATPRLPVPANRHELSIDMPGAGCTSFLGTAAVRRGPIGGLVVSADGRRLMATNYGDDSVSVIDTGTGAVVRTARGVPEPFAVATGRRANSRNAGRAYVGTASATCDSVLTIDLTTAHVIAANPVALSISDLVADPSGRRVYVARTGPSGADVLVLDAAGGALGATDLATTPGASATCVRISPDGRQLYVAVQRPADDAVVVLDSDLNILDVIEVGASVRDIAVSPDGGTVFLAGDHPAFGGCVGVVDTRTNAVTDRVVAGGEVAQLTMSGEGDRVYLITGEAVVAMCARTHQLAGTIAVGAQPSCAVASPDGNRLYIGDYAGAVTAVPVTAPLPPLAPLPAEHLLDDSLAALLELEPAF